jgi:TolA-binding protein
MKIENYYDRIDQYHAGELSDSDSKSFEQELNNNEELRRAEELYRLSLHVLDYGAEENLRKDLKKWNSEGSTVSTGGRIVSLRRRSLQILSAAAAVLLLIFVVRSFLMPQASSDELFATYYQTPSQSGWRGNADAQNALTSAKKALAEESYADAIDGFSEIAPTDPLYFEAQYYLGHALVGLNNLNAAKKAFEAVANSEDKFQEKGEWNYLLVCMKAKQWNVECEAKLKNIAADEGHSFYPEAKELLKKMK